MSAPPFNVGAYVLGAPTSPRDLIQHDSLLNAYADGALEDEREAYLSHFVFGSEMTAHYRGNRKSVAGFVGPCACRWLTLDIDRPDLVDALADARRLVQAIGQRYAEMESAVPIYFSGGKGFHVLVELAHKPPPAVGSRATVFPYPNAILRCPLFSSFSLPISFAGRSSCSFAGSSASSATAICCRTNKMA